MAYDEGLAERLRDYFEGQSDIEIKKMFGGLCFMVSEHMCCGIVGDMFMARVGPDRYEECLGKKHAVEMDFTGKAMKGMVYVKPKGLEEDSELKKWMGICESFVMTLPPKKPKVRKKT